MFGDSEAMSDRALPIHMGSDDDLSSHFRLEYWFDNSSVFYRESALDSFSREASPSGR